MEKKKRNNRDNFEFNIVENLENIGEQLKILLLLTALF